MRMTRLAFEKGILSFTMHQSPVTKIFLGKFPRISMLKLSNFYKVKAFAPWNNLECHNKINRGKKCQCFYPENMYYPENEIEKY